MRRPIAFIDTTTSRTGTRRVARINRNNGYTCALCFVGYESTQLVERPRVQNRPLAAPSSYPFADIRQVFQRNPATGVFGGFNDSFAQGVVNVSSEAAFLAGKGFQAAFGRSGLFSLQLGAQATVTVANVLDRLALVDVAVTVNGDVVDTKVNSKEAFGVNLRRFFNIAALVKIELAIAKDKIALAMQTLKQLGLSFAAYERHFLAARHCPDRDGALSELVGHKPVIERESSQWPKGMLGLTVFLVGVGHLGKDTHSNISTKAESFSDIRIAELVQSELPENPFPPRLATDIVARSVSGLKCLFECSMLFWRRLEFDLSNQLHTEIIPSIGNFAKKEELWQHSQNDR